MKYSFILIAYNEERNITQCIESILSQEDLGSSYEILVIDDGSHDKTSEYVQVMMKSNKKIRLLGDSRNHGRGYGRYVGVAKSTGSLVAMVDADIILPKTWLKTCLKAISKNDVVGGIAVPDGDVAYLYRRFRLKPKTVMGGSTTITGNNGLYKREVFKKAEFNKNLREGEDVDFNHQLKATSFSSRCIAGLVVEHQEHKSLLRSMFWLYQTGIGATRQLANFKEVRLPDMAFFGTVLALVFSVMISLITKNAVWLILPLLCLAGTSFMHLHTKFGVSLKGLFMWLCAFVVNTVLIFCYYVGRLVATILLFTKVV
jgi:glycosyltransferase involved in cell wall biosynthesis